jgi:hypothetical protein
MMLGGVWSLVFVMLPRQDDGDVSLAQSMPSKRQPVVSAPLPDVPVPPDDLPLATLPPPDPLPAPPQPEKDVFPAAVPLSLEMRCDGEIESACPEASDEDRGRCIQNKLRRLPAPCRQLARQQLVRMKAHLSHMRMACEADVRRFCRDVESAGGSALQCLEAHAQDVSDICFQALPKRGRLLR